MNYDPMPIISSEGKKDIIQPANTEKKSDQAVNQKVEKFSFYVFLITVILAPIAFWANPYISVDIVKTFVISVGSIVSAILLSFMIMKERKIILPPKSLLRTGIFLIISITISSIISLHFSRSFFGQGFEIGTASFILLLFLSGLVAFHLTSRNKDRAVVLYVGIVVAYVILFVIHLLRIVFGEKFMTLNVMNSATASIFGNWYSLGSFSAIIVIVSLLALLLLKLPSKLKIVYWALLVISTISLIVIADTRIWGVITLVFLGLSVFLSLEKWSSNKKNIGKNFSAIIRSLSLIPVIALLISVFLVWRGPSFVGPLVSKIGIGHAEMVLPWQMTLNVTASAIQNYPLFGIGSNNFSQAYLAFKPLGINSTNVWSAEFAYGFGLLPTFVSLHGVIGSILWILILVFFGIISAKILKRLPNDSESKYMIVSSFVISAFLWLSLLVTVPSHAILFFAFMFSGIFIGLSYSYGLIEPRSYSPVSGTWIHKMFPSIVAIFIIIFVSWGLVYIKKTFALVYFGKGIQTLNVAGDPNLADKAFTKALRLDQSDVYWRAKAETALIYAERLASTVTPAMSASSTQAILTEINTVLNQGLVDAKNAIVYDPTNYYNYLSEARISEAAANIKMQNGYENAVNAYTSASNLNPYNPAIHRSLASLHARQGKYDEALNSLGRSLQIKDNYLDAIFLLSQIYATKGDINNAIIAAKVAVGLNPQNPVSQFQLGILSYSNKDYNGAANALGEALKYQPDYANAKYFLGLAEARLNKIDQAITRFEDLSKTNPDNEEVALILANLKSGKSIFNDVVLQNAPEKRSDLPVKEKK